MNNSWAVDVQNLSVKFGDFTAVKNVSFQVAHGEIFGFLGANGAGKTTTIRVLCGLLNPTEGKVKVAGLDSRDGLLPIKRRVGYMSQRFTLYDDMTVLENLEFAAALRKMSSDDLRKRSKELFELIGFDQPTSTLVRNLAGGYKQELSLAQALLHDPQIIFLDEPTAGVAPAARARFWALIRKIVAQGKTVFVTTHYMDEAEQCGRITLMHDGRLIALDSPQALKESSFPESLIEITEIGHPDSKWVEEIRKNPAILSLKPYGQRWHAILKSPNDLADLEQALEGRCELREIKPSLEDVFIRLIEREIS